MSLSICLGQNISGFESKFLLTIQNLQMTVIEGLQNGPCAREKTGTDIFE